MHVFAADIWLRYVGRILRLFLKFLLQIGANLRRLGVHPAFHVGNVPVLRIMEYALVMNQPSRIHSMEILRHSCNVLPRVGLISTGPDQYRGMILIPFIHGAGPVQNSLPPLRKISRHIVRRLHLAQLLPGSVALQIRLINQIYPVFITEPIPESLIGIVTGPYRIDIVLLQNPDILKHFLPGNAASAGQRELMPVHPSENDAFSVEAHDSVPQNKATESNPLRNPFDLYFLISHKKGQAVKSRILGAPGAYVLNPYLPGVTYLTGMVEQAAHCITPDLTLPANRFWREYLILV